MRVERKKEVNVARERVPSSDSGLRRKKVDKDADEEKKSDGKSKSVSQLDKQISSKDQEEEKENINLANIIRLLKEEYFITDDEKSEVISRSPMRFQDCHHASTKPYEYPYNVSKVYGGVTRVVEGDRGNSSFYRRFCNTLQSSNGPNEGHVGDVDLGDINMWLNLCKRDPKLLSDFVEDCQNEFSKKEISNPFEYRSNSNLCSNVSSQFTSPAQSPSERSLTSPESVGTYEENSLYHSTSPNIPSFDGFTLKPDEKEAEKTSSPTKQQKVEQYAHCPQASESVASDDSGTNRVTDSVPNIGTVMLNLAEDPYESTVDLNQFSTVCDTSAEISEPYSTERDALNEKLEKKAKENAWTRISQLNIDLLGKGDKDGDTQLMILLVSEKLTLEYIYVIVERLLKENPEYLSCRNELNQDALYLAALTLVHEPLVVSYLAEALVRGKQDVNKKYDGGNSLLHCLAKKGDSHTKVLERLVKLRDSNRAVVFDINKKNNRGFTPLHVACEVHRKDILHTYQTVRVLVDNGADSTAKEYKDENTPLHTLITESCDIDLLRIILESDSKMTSNGGPNVCNRQGNTPLHLSCGRNTLELEQQKGVIGLLLRHGAMIHLKNINGFVPSVLVNSTRKQFPSEADVNCLPEGTLRSLIEDFPGCLQLSNLCNLKWSGMDKAQELFLGRDVTMAVPGSGTMPHWTREGVTNRWLGDNFRFFT
ncbi:hypothetical protein RUM43_001188 [Polyplax serrata]|uniref:Uncharacterized protein n=1 Tax=Polyplax serrata TaxID=468196 RepID=A0AAN8SE03_POLSC